jgi:hypothetical protein
MHIGASAVASRLAYFAQDVMGSCLEEDVRWHEGFLAAMEVVRERILMRVEGEGREARDPAARPLKNLLLPPSQLAAHSHQDLQNGENGGKVHDCSHG